MSDKLLEIFSHEEFDAENYVNAFLNATKGPQQQQLATNLLERVDWYSSSLTNQLKTKISQLQHSTEHISKDSTRLEYYVDTLASTVNNLQDELHHVASQKPVSGQLESLIELKKIQKHMQQTQSVMETIKDIVSIVASGTVSSAAPTGGETQSVTITPETLKVALEELKLTITQTVRNGKGANMLGKMKELISMQQVWEDLEDFSAVWSEFATVLKQEVDVLEVKH